MTKDMRIKLHRLSRVVAGILIGFILIAYVAAKIDFYRNYFRLGFFAYVREHRIYWILMLALALLVFLIGKIFPEEPDS